MAILAFLYPLSFHLWNALHNRYHFHSVVFHNLELSHSHPFYHRHRIHLPAKSQPPYSLHRSHLVLGLCLPQQVIFDILLMLGIWICLYFQSWNLKYPTYLPKPSRYSLVIPISLETAYPQLTVAPRSQTHFDWGQVRYSCDLSKVNLHQAPRIQWNAWCDTMNPSGTSPWSLAWKLSFACSLQAVLLSGCSRGC